MKRMLRGLEEYGKPADIPIEDSKLSDADKKT
jgi:hypothetical protein